LFLSRTDRKKGLELLVEAFTQISRRFSSALLVIAGAGDNAHEMELRARAETLGISGDMVWTGFLGPEDKANALGAATVFVLPSYSENFGIAAAEAMAAGVPTILSEGVAIAEYSVASQAALIVPPQAKAIADALELVLKDRELRKRLSNNGRALCQERFSVNAVGMALKDLYDSVLDAAGRPTANS
jgi:glycosyltransferase involved in cell wall biosynthesis